MNIKEANKVLEELRKDVRPEMLNDKAIRLFNAIMKIADERDEIKSDLYEANNRINDLLEIVDEKDKRLKRQEKLITKRDKEIEELYLENIELKQSKIVDKNSIPNQNNFYDCYNFIHKDKIKAKIEELNKEEKQMLKGTKGQDRYAIKQEYMYKRSGLQSLLEKE